MCSFFSEAIVFFFLILKGKGDIRFCTEHKHETNSLVQLLYNFQESLYTKFYV